MKVVETIEAWMRAIGDDWNAKPAREKNIVAFVAIEMLVVAIMQLAWPSE